MSEPQITLSHNAARRVAWIASRQQKPAILRLAVDGGGCAGFTYKFELAAEAESDDEIVETDGVKLVVDPISLDLVRGSAVDFVEDLGGAAFRGDEPQRAVRVWLRLELFGLALAGVSRGVRGACCP